MTIRNATTARVYRGKETQHESARSAGKLMSYSVRRALVGAGYVRLELLTNCTEAEILRLHGMGPKAMDQLRCALAARGLSFASSKSGQAKSKE